jgi:NAD(P)-dependent dehydrogenase (short-subunit alcohol dehydrogenase family)
MHRDGKTCVDYGLAKRVALITGAAGSIGRGIALGFAKEGAKSFITDLHEEPLRGVESEIRAAGGECASLAADVVKADRVKAVVSEAMSTFGRVDILVNVAGLVRQNKIEDTDEREWDEVFDVNCRGTFFFIREAVPVMKHQRYGRVINFSSKSGKTGSALIAPYSAAKAAVIGLTQALAHELAEFGINVNCVCPGLVEDTGVWNTLSADYEKNLKQNKVGVTAAFTKKVPLRRLAKVEDVVSIVLFLSSTGADYMTGQAINITGGREMH